MGVRALDLLIWRDKNSKRETRVLGMLYFIHTTVWKTLFGKQADSLEKSTENEDECRLNAKGPSRLDIRFTAITLTLTLPLDPHRHDFG